MKLTERQRRYVLFVFAFALVTMWFVLFGVYLVASNRGVSIDSVRSFATEWGGAVGVAATALVGILAALIPSQVESDVRRISEAIQGSLSTFSQVRRKSYELLQAIANDDESQFIMASAAPILGIEFPEQERRQFWVLVSQRIVAGRETRFLSLDWAGSTGAAKESPLWRFCTALATDYADDPDQAPQYFETAVEAIDGVIALSEEHETCSLKLLDELPLGVVLVTDGSGKRRGIVYFASSASLSRNIPAQGIYTEDEKLVEFIYEVFRSLDEPSKPAARFDPRTSLQKLRDKQLVAGARMTAYVVEMDGFTITVEPGVFPPDQALTTGMLGGAIDEAAKLVFSNVPREQRVGIDVGTGTGILALALARQCTSVCATDIDSGAVDNARSNVESNRHLLPKDVQIEIECGDLLAPVKELAKDSVPLIVFNHPYYPSPVDLYHIGGPDAGLPLISRFMEQARPVIESSGGILMPYSSVAGEHNPVTVAASLGLSATEIETREGTLDSNRVSDYVYLFMAR